MSENLELVRSIFAAWERGDFGSADWADTEIDFVFADGPSPGSWKGLPGMAEGIRELLSAWDDWHIKAHELRVLDDERVLVFTRISGRGKTSGLKLSDMHDRSANLFHVRSGMVTRLVLYWDRDRALADLGLEE